MCPRRAVERKSQPAINQLFPQEVAGCQNTCCSQIILNLNKNQPEGFGELNVIQNSGESSKVTKMNLDGFSYKSAHTFFFLNIED